MGLAAMAFVVLVVLVIAVFVFYGIVIGLVKLVRLPGQVSRWSKAAAAPARAEWPASGNGKEASCWEFRDCPQVVRDTCPAYLDPDSPCWLSSLRQTGRIKARCMECPRFSVTEYVEQA